METTTTPTLEESLAKFAARVAEGKATSDELAFMMKVATCCKEIHAISFDAKKYLTAY